MDVVDWENLYARCEQYEKTGRLSDLLRPQNIITNPHIPKNVVAIIQGDKILDIVKLGDENG